LKRRKQDLMGLSAIKALPHYKLVLVNQLTRQGKK
jgi:hypothetical protein